MPTGGATATEALLGVERSVLGRPWRERPHDPRVALAHSQSLGIPELLGRVLAARGVPISDGAQYLCPTLRELMPDPATLRDMDRACGRLADAVIADERIAVFGDYDVDGATSAAMLARFFRAAGRDIILYVPDRMKEGYGPNAAALRGLADAGARVVVTVDCGTLAFEALEAAAQVGLDTIVVDHHIAQPALPKAHAVINPNRLDETGALSQLAAVGVAFLLVVAVNRRLREAGWYTAQRPEPSLLQWLDLVALGTICDVVPLTGLNRALVLQGLKVMARRANPGLAALADVAGTEERPSAYLAGFVLGPRVNAGGRVGRADAGANLLSTDDPAEARRIAEELDTFNAERRAIEAAVQEAVIAKADAGGDDGPIAVIAGAGWHPGVIGIVASRLRDHVGKPAMVIGVENGIGKGSGRSLPGFDLGAAVIAAGEAGLLVNGGGHAMAAGLTVNEDRIPDLREFLATRAGAAGGAGAGERALNIDGALAVGGATPDLIALLERAGPYGSGNSEPRFAIANARLVVADTVGANHVRCILAGDDGARLKGIAFRALETPLGTMLLERRGKRVHVAGRLRADNWKGRNGVEIRIEDAAPAG
jgi:single-stranded-DNA-specific exonuclease